jgi:kynurenine formamidase
VVSTEVHFTERDSCWVGITGLGAARYLAQLSVVAVGADNWALEVIPAEKDGEVFPVHPELVAKNGVYVLENMDSQELAIDGVAKFLFVLGQPRFEGAVQAVIKPFLDLPKRNQLDPFMFNKKAEI